MKFKMLFRESKRIVLDLGCNVIKLVGVQEKNPRQIEFVKMIDIYQTGRVARPDDLTVTLIVQLLRTLRIGGRRVRTILSTPSTHMRVIELPLLADGELKTAIRLNLTGGLPYETDAIEFDYIVLAIDRQLKKQTLLVGVTKSNDLNRHQEILTRAGLEAEIVAIDQLALNTLWQKAHPPKNSRPVMLVNIGAERTTFNLMDETHRPSFNAIALGGNQVTGAVERRFHTSFANAEQQKIAAQSDPAVTAGTPVDWETEAETLASRLAVIIHDLDISYRINFGAEELGEIWLCGGGALLKGLDYQLASLLKVPVRLWNPLLDNYFTHGLSPAEVKALGPFLAPALGLALQEET